MVLLVINQLAASQAASDDQLMEDVVNRKADALESIYRKRQSNTPSRRGALML
jgi:hypothetical protein